MWALARQASFLGALAILTLLPSGGAGAEPDFQTFEQTPPRLALVEGAVTFWRPGAGDREPARVNAALAAGDHLETGEDSRLELQIGPRSFLRAGDETELAIQSREPLLRVGIATGVVSLDLGSLPSGGRIELDTPNAAVAIEAGGRYRIDIERGTTTLTCRDGGSAALSPPGGEAIVVASGEQVAITGARAAVETAAAPALDDWERWNDERFASLAGGPSAQYVGGDVYGAGDLDRHGGWITVAPYGPVWTPTRVPQGWAPYGLGRWMWDPVFRWTWVDDAPWGWAPFHHGRWVFVRGGGWAWTPGALVARSLYAPALVAFPGAPRSSFRWHTPAPVWVPLGFGEPCVPWWGPRGWLGTPQWLGFRGPRIIGAPLRVPGGHRLGLEGGTHRAIAPALLPSLRSHDVSARPLDRIRAPSVGLPDVRTRSGRVGVGMGSAPRWSTPSPARLAR